MKVVALIDCPGLIRRILEHLNLWKPVNRMFRPRSPPIEAFLEAYLFPGGDTQFALPLGAVELGKGWIKFRRTTSRPLFIADFLQYTNRTSSPVSEHD